MSKPFINPETAMQDALTSLSKLTFKQLVILQANLSNHILECYNYAELQKGKAEALAANEKANPKPSA